jgi:hypothetical protein
MNQCIHIALLPISAMLYAGCASSVRTAPPASSASAALSSKAAEVTPLPANSPANSTPGEAFERVWTPLFETRSESLRLARATWVLATPSADGQRLGLIGGGTRVPEKSHVLNDECPSPWIEVEPQGWVCVAVKASPRPPSSAQPARVMRKLPGTYAIATKSTRFFKSLAAAQEGQRSRPALGDMVKRRKVVHLEDGQTMWRTDRGEFVDPSTLRRLGGSRFQGVDLRDEHSPSLPFAFAIHANNATKSVLVRRAPSASARVVRRLPRRSVVEVLGHSEEGEYVEISDGEWIAQADLRIVRSRARPAGVAQGARWVDVDLDQQLVVAYEGSQAVFATLASTGKGKDATPTGVFHITRKKRHTTMRNDRSKKQSYSVAVPWPVYFNKGFAFHSTYWHNGFGSPRSHGCVNLSPSDATKLYSFVGPEMPAGWTVVYGHKSQPGTAIHVHSSKGNVHVGSDTRLASQ